MRSAFHEARWNLTNSLSPPCVSHETCALIHIKEIFTLVIITHVIL